MEPEVRKRTNKIKPKIIIVSLVMFILLMLAVAGQLIYTVLSYDRIYKGVCIENQDIGGMTRDELGRFLEKNYQEHAAGLQFTLKAENSTETFKSEDIGVDYDIPQAVQTAFEVGRTGNLFQKLIEVYKTGKTGIVLEMPVAFDRDKLENRVQSFYDRTLVKVKEADVLIQDDKVTVRTGHHGKNIDKEFALSALEKSIREHTGAVIDIPFIITPPNKINIDELHGQISTEPVNAATKVENNTVAVVPHVVGRSIEKSVLASIAQELDEQENVERVLPVTFSQPEIVADMVYDLLFKDTLATISTSFTTSSENNRNRAENIKLAVSKIDGKILAPGDVFSFNGVVGPRTVEGGYKAAHAFLKGKVVDDVGGGICQVSSTLYNAVLFSDLEVVERRNHMFTVGYVPKGRDATVSYGGPDFKFKNSTRWPIKVSAWVTSNNKVFFSLKGTNEHAGREVEIVQTTVKTTPFKTIYIDDPTLFEGQTVVKQNGSDGFVVDTYKIIKQDGKVVSQNKIHTSTYQPLNKEVRRGTKKAPPADTGPAGTQTSPIDNHGDGGEAGNAENG